MKDIDPDKIDMNEFMKSAQTYKKKPIPVKAKQMKTQFNVKSKEGWISGKAGDYLIIGIRGEPYPCDKDIFEESYEVVK